MNKTAAANKGYKNCHDISNFKGCNPLQLVRMLTENRPQLSKAFS
jgi:hypothetical protein